MKFELLTHKDLRKQIQESRKAVKEGREESWEKVNEELKKVDPSQKNIKLKTQVFAGPVSALHPGVLNILRRGR